MPQRLTTLEVFPPDVNLDTARDRQSFVVQATYADGITRDVTAEAKVAARQPGPGEARQERRPPRRRRRDRAERRVRRQDGQACR